MKIQRLILLGLICSLVMPLFALAQTEVEGEVEGVWSLEDSPFLVVGDLWIENDNQLTIEPGVEILFQGEFSLSVSGRISALGNANNRITFRSNDENEFWRSIRFDRGQGGSIFNHCLIENSEVDERYNLPDSRGAAIYAEDTNDLTISNCEIRNTVGQGQGTITLYNCTGEIFNNHIHHNETFTEIVWLENSAFDVHHNLIEHNISDHGAGIITEQRASNIHHNIVRYNTSVIMHWGCALYAAYNSQATFSYNLVYGNDGGGFYAGVGSNIEVFDHNTFSNNINGPIVLVFNNSSVNCTNSILHSNFEIVQTTNGGQFQSQFNFLSDEDIDIEFGEGNIFGNAPGFSDPESDDFNLQPNSPCIDAGDPDFERDIDGSITDIGALSFFPMEGNPEILVDPLIISVEEPGEYVINIANNGDSDLWFRTELAENWVGIDNGEELVVPDGDIDVFICIDENLRPGAYQTTLYIFSNDLDNPRIAIPILYNNDAGQQPRWHDFPNRIVCTECDTLIHAVRGIDPDGDDLTITYNSDDLPWNFFFTDRHDGTGLIEWVTDYDNEGIYTATFTLSDEFWSISRDVQIVVNKLNRPPEVRRPIVAYVADEDSDPVTLGRIGDVFRDPDPEDRDSLQYGIMLCAGIEAWMTDNGNLACAPLRNWNGESILTLFATDGVDTARNDINVTINPVNDLPTEFALLSPDNESTVEFSDSLTLCWEASVDAVEDSSVCYALGLFFSHQSRWFYEIDTPEFTINSDIIQLSDGVPVEVEWQVWAYDGTDSLCCSQPFSFRAEYNLVDENGNTIPTAFALHDPYPNPFNNEVKIHIDLPIAADVNLSLFDLMGRQVHSIQQGVMPVGRHCITYNANGLTNGVYILQYATPEGIFGRKLTLLQ